MIQKLRNLLRPYYIYLKSFLSIIINYIADFLLFGIYSLVFKSNRFEHFEAEIILHYHAIEKGFLHFDTKHRFACNRIIALHNLLSKNVVVVNRHRSQINVAYALMCRYYEVHESVGVDISDYYTFSQYSAYVNLLHKIDSRELNGVKEYDRTTFYENVEGSNFFDFSYSRQSIRNFSGTQINVDVLHRVVNLANNAPSVCNRQASKVYLVSQKEVIDKLLLIQGGFTGFTQNVSQLLIVTNDIKFYYTVGERNQMFIDGGVYLLNLLYSLHYFKVANCPANWGKTITEDRLLRKLINIPYSERVICLIPIGVASETFRTTLSKRREATENFVII
jgi:nitroreductase